jgi:quercetin dioxygenase-like cupin family protein
MRACTAATLVGAALLTLAVACERTSPGPAPASGDTPSASSASVVAATASATATPGLSSRPAVAPLSAAPLQARLIELHGATPLRAGPCDELFLHALSGKAAYAGASLAAGDSLYVKHPDTMDLTGEGRVVVALYVGQCAILDKPVAELTRIAADAKAPLVFAKGAMRATLDTEGLSTSAYMGRLAGTAPVAEHTHEAAWEILVAHEAAGTFTVNGAAQRLGPGQIVVIPPGAKHSWQPDAGVALAGVQFYVPPGPEQRFKALAAAK